VRGAQIIDAKLFICHYPFGAGTALLLAMLMTTATGWSQESRGTILGRVTDSSGSVVPAASVQAANLATCITLSGQTNAEGNYFFPLLNPGQCRVTAEKTGFKRIVRDGIEVNVNARLELNLALEIDAMTESVTVTDEAQKDQPWQTLNTNYAMAGSRAGKGEFTLDGTSNTIHDQARGSVTAARAPPSDTVAEFKIQTAAFNVTTGQTKGGVVNISLKSGTNNLHASFYWVKQSPWMNANTWFFNINRQPRGDFTYDRLGGVLNGPVIILKLYSGKNRTFFLFSYEDIRTVQAALSAFANFTVPTAAQRDGNFSALLALGPSYQIYDPYTRMPTTGGRFTNQPLAGNIIPPNQISSIAQNLLTYYPKPEQTGTADGGNNLDRTSWPSSVWHRTHIYRFDHNVNARNRLMFRTKFRFHNIVDTDYFGFDYPSRHVFLERVVQLRLR
jgi:hypothetical protein